MAWIIIVPMPGRLKICSTITVPPNARPRDTPMTVMTENDDGRSASRQRIRHRGMPLARAARMKSSCSVEMRSLRSSRIHTAVSTRARVRAGRNAEFRFARRPALVMRSKPWRGKSGKLKKRRSSRVAPTAISPPDRTR